MMGNAPKNRGNINISDIRLRVYPLTGKSLAYTYFITRAVEEVR